MFETFMTIFPIVYAGRRPRAIGFDLIAGVSNNNIIEVIGYGLK